ncbi:methyltransferase [Patescibacteria group bacterium]
MIDKIKIKNCLNVYPGGQETVAMAKIALEQKCYSFLDIGTGNGYIAIFLHKNGRDAEALDISLRAVKCARINAKLNNCKLEVFQSDLFEQVNNKYDCITFILPINSNEKEYQRVAKSLIRYFPFLLNLLRPFFHSITRKNRIKLINKFIFQARNYLNSNGQILISLPTNDVNYIDKEDIVINAINRPTELITIYQIWFNKKN